MKMTSRFNLSSFGFAPANFRFRSLGLVVTAVAIMTTQTACHDECLPEFEGFDEEQIAACFEICEEVSDAVEPEGDDGERGEEAEFQCVRTCLDDLAGEPEPPPEATEPDATEPEATEPEATEPEATEPEATEPEVTEPPVVDSDGDGFSDDAEIERGTNPNDADTDGDGESDGLEIDCGSSPLDPQWTCATVDQCE